MTSEAGAPTMPVAFARGARPDVLEPLRLQQIGDEAERHADAGGGEAPVPAIGGVESIARCSQFLNVSLWARKPVTSGASAAPTLIPM